MLKIPREITDADLREEAQNSRMQKEATAQFKIPPGIRRRFKKMLSYKKSTKCLSLNSLILNVLRMPSIFGKGWDYFAQLTLCY